MARALLLAAAAAAHADPLPAPCPSLPACLCTPSTFDCRGRNVTSFPVGTFRGLSALQSIDLSGNKATALPVGLFSGLPSLASLSLLHNPLATLPAGLFAGLGALATLNLAGLPLNASFDAAAMVGALPALTDLYLDGSTLLGGGGACPDLSPLAALAPSPRLRAVRS